MKPTHAILSALLIFVLSFQANAQSLTVPALTPYQGRLTDASGNPVADGNGYEIEVRLWPATTGGSAPIWATRYSGIAVKSGALNIILGSPSGTPIAGATTTDLKTAFTTTNVFIGLTVTKGATGAPIANPTEVLPRQQILSSPYALKANSASTSDSSAFAQSIGDGSVTTSKIADGSVTGQKLASGAIGTDNLNNSAVTPAKLNPTCAIFSEQFPSGTAPQSPKIGWQKRTLNTQEINVGGDVSFDPSNAHFTLNPGVYEIEASIPYMSNWNASGWGCWHRGALKKLSDGTLIALTTNYFSEQPGSNYAVGWTGGTIMVHTIVWVPSGGESFELAHFIQDEYRRVANGTAGSASIYGGCGLPTSSPGLSETYSRVIIKRLQ